MKEDKGEAGECFLAPQKVILKYTVKRCMVEGNHGRSRMWCTTLVFMVINSLNWKSMKDAFWINNHTDNSFIFNNINSWNLFLPTIVSPRYFLVRCYRVVRQCICIGKHWRSSGIWEIYLLESIWLVYKLGWFFYLFHMEADLALENVN